jgi:hypothetical protein
MDGSPNSFPVFRFRLCPLYFGFRFFAFAHLAITALRAASERQIRVA